MSNVARLQLALGEDLVYQSAQAVLDIVRKDQVIARLHRLHPGVHDRESGAEYERFAAVLKGSETRFKRPAGPGSLCANR